MSGLERFKSRHTDTTRIRQKEFATMELALAAAAARAAGCPGAGVLVLLRYMAWRAESTTFPVPNTMFARYGISRHVKYRVLANLERAGWIKIQCRGRRGSRSSKTSPLITLLKPLG